MTNIKRINKGLYWDRSWRVVNGCTKVSPGCTRCWSEAETNVRGSNPAVAYRYAKDEVLTAGKWNGRIALATERVLEEPLRAKKPQVWTIWNDLFHEDVPPEVILDVFIRIEKARQHTFLILTKRPERMKRLATMAADPDFLGNVLPNLWLGVTAENQEMADQRIPILLQTPAAKRFVSVEPMLGPVDLERYLSGWGDREGFESWNLDWVICGKENAPGARPMDLAWPRSLRDQCRSAGVPFFMKGKILPEDLM